MLVSVAAPSEGGGLIAPISLAAVESVPVCEAPAAAAVVDAIAMSVDDPPPETAVGPALVTADSRAVVGVVVEASVSTTASSVLAGTELVAIEETEEAASSIVLLVSGTTVSTWTEDVCVAAAAALGAAAVGGD